MEEMSSFFLEQPKAYFISDAVLEVDIWCLISRDYA